MEIEPVFEITDGGRAVPTWQPRDGRRYLWADEAARITGQAVDTLLREFGGLFDITMFGDRIGADASVDPPPVVGGSPAAVPTEPPVEHRDARLIAKREKLIDELRRFVFPGLNDQDILDAARFARRRGLDPWAGHVWAERVRFEDSDESRLVVGLTAEGFREIVREHPKFAGMDAVEWIKNAHGQLERCRSTMYRYDDHREKIRVVTEVTWDAAYQGTRLWDEKPDQMLGIAARNANCRDTFGGRTSGMYSREELAGMLGGKSRQRPGRERVAPATPADVEDANITSPGQLQRVLVTDYGLRGEAKFRVLLATFRKKYPRLPPESPELFSHIMRDVRANPVLYGMTAPEAAEA